jgi:hypothetical protein
MNYMNRFLSVSSKTCNTVKLKQILDIWSWWWDEEIVELSLDGPSMVSITPLTQSYTLKERENLNQIQCIADCLPVCTMTWSGPNLPAGTTSVLITLVVTGADSWIYYHDHDGP